MRAEQWLAYSSVTHVLLLGRKKVEMTKDVRSLAQFWDAFSKNISSASFGGFATICSVSELKSLLLAAS